MIAIVSKAVRGANWGKLNFWLGVWTALFFGFVIGQYIGEKKEELNQTTIQLEQQGIDFNEQIIIFRDIPDSTDAGFWKWMRSR